MAGPGDTDNAAFAIQANTLTTNAVFDYEAKRVYSVRVRASDQGGLSTEKVFTVTVTDVNEAPALNVIVDQTVVLTHELQLVASATDPDGSAQLLIFSLRPGAPPGATIDPVTRAFTWTPTLPERPGIYPITVRVTDNGSPALFAEQTFNVTVLPNLDADGNGVADAITDGTIILRYLSGHPDSQLLSGGVLGSGATRTDPAVIRSYLNAGKILAPEMLDVDRNGQFGALTDGRLISRYLSGATGAALVGGSVIGPGATRTTAAAITAYLDGFRPVSPGRVAFALASAPMVVPTTDATVAPQPLTSEPAGTLSAAPSEIVPAAPTWALTAEATPTTASATAITKLTLPVTDPLVSGTGDDVFGSDDGHYRPNGGVGQARLVGARSVGQELGARLMEAQKHDLSIDWSRRWAGWQNGHKSESGSRLLKPFVLEFAEDDPNRGLQVVVAGHAEADDDCESVS